MPPVALVIESRPRSSRMPWALSCRARSRSIGPERAVRSSVGSPLSSRVQEPTHAPLAGSTCPRPITRVAIRASPPSTLRANPVVNTFAVEAGANALSGLADQSSRPSPSTIATPHLPGATRWARAYHSSRERASSPEMV